MMQNKIKLVLSALLFAGLASFIITRVRSEWTLRSLLETTSGHDDEGPSIPQDPATFARWHQFDTIWQTRSTHNVTEQLLPFLKDPFIPLRERTIRSLGELEDPKSEPALSDLLTQSESKNSPLQLNDISVLSLKLALGRIHSRNLHGEEKVATTVNAVGLTWPYTVKLFQRINALQPPERAQTEGNEIVNSVGDLLCSMADRGEDISSLVKQLSLRPSQQVLFQAAPLPTDQEVKLLLNSFSRFNVFIDRGQLSVRLMDLRPRSTELLIEYLQDVNVHPEQYRKTSVESFSGLFFLAALMDDARVLPLLKKFEANPKPWPDLRHEAQVAEQIAKARVRLLATKAVVN